MNLCFPQFVYGKFTFPQESGYTLVGITPDLQQAEIIKLLSYASTGQSFSKFEPIYNLSEIIEDYRLFAKTFINNTVTERRPFSMVHGVLLKDPLLESFSVQKIVREFQKHNLDRQFSHIETLTPFCIDANPVLDIAVWDKLGDYLISILMVIDTIFQSKVIVLVNSSELSLSLADAICTLLPKNLQKYFSFHSNFFGMASRTKSLVKFKTDFDVINDSDHAIIKLQSNANINHQAILHSDYGLTLYKLLFEKKITIYKVAQICQSMNTPCNGFNLQTSQVLSSELRRLNA